MIVKLKESCLSIVISVSLNLPGAILKSEIFNWIGILFYFKIKGFLSCSDLILND